MKHILIATSFLTTAAAVAAPYTGKGIAVDDGAVIHYDAEIAKNSPITKAINELGLDKNNTKTFDEFGLDQKSLADATVVIAPPKQGNPEVTAAIQLRGAFNRAKFLAAAKKHGVASTAAGKHNVYALADLAPIFLPKDSKPKSGKPIKGFLVPVSDSLILITTNREQVDTQLKAIDAGTVYNNAKATAALTGGKYTLAGYMPESFFADARKESEYTPKSLVFNLGETGGNVVLKAVAKLSSAEAVQKVAGQAAMYKGMAPMFLGQPQKNETAEQKADREFYLSLVNGISIGNEGDDFLLGFEYPAAALAKKIREKKSDITDMAVR